MLSTGLHFASESTDAFAKAFFISPLSTEATRAGYRWPLHPSRRRLGPRGLSCRAYS